MQHLLREVATIKPGTHAPDTSHGDGYLLQPRHFDRLSEITSELIPQIRVTPRLNKYTLHPGDVLLTAKGREHFAVNFTGQVSPAIPASAFILIRLSQQNFILPQYLCWFLNHPESQKRLSASAKGTSLPSLTTIDVGDIPVMVPSLFKQQYILRLAELQVEKERIIREIADKQRRLLQHHLFTIARQDS